MRRSRLLISTLALAAAASTAAIIPATSAQAATNGLSIRTLTKTLVQGDTSRVQGQIVGAGKQTLTIQQRSPQKNKGWGSGRQVTTDSNGKFTYDRVIKGKFTRDYRVCKGAPGKRKCSLRARIEVTPRTIGIFPQQFPAQVQSGAQSTVRGSTDAALVGRTVQLQELNPSNLQYYTVGTATVTPASTFEVSGVPLVPGKNRTFKVITAPFAGRSQVTTSYTFVSTVFASYALTTYPAVQGGYQAAQPIKGGQTYTSAVTPTAVANAGTFTVNLAGNCNRITADVFLADNAATAATDRMNTSVVTAIGGNETTKFGRGNMNTPPDALTQADPVQKLDANIADAQTLRITQNVTPNTGSQTNTFAPVYYANATLSCAY